MAELKDLPIPEDQKIRETTPVDRLNVLIGSPKGATYVLNAILDEYGAVDLLNCFFPNLEEKEQQRLIDLVHYRMFAETQNKPKVNDEYDYKGQRKSLREWCVIVKLPEDTVAKRLLRGWSIEKALETPIRHARIRAGTCGF